jgi:hypothetical protein
MRKFLLFTLLVLVFGTASVFAQNEDADSPFLEMLARIPAQSGANEWLTYIDYHAIIDARPDAPSVHSWEEASAILDGEDQESDLFMSALMSFRSGPQEVPQHLMRADETIDAIGLDLFAVERAVQYGLPPTTVTILDGDFDNDAIAAAFAERDYTQADEAGLTLLCPEAGCDTGMETNLANRDTANIFGGELGRSQPILLGEQWLASSASDQVLSTVAATSSDEIDSLLDEPAYRAAAEALSAQGTVLQAYFISPVDIGGSLTDILLMNPRITPEQIEAIREAYETDFVPLPPYSLVALAQIAAEDEDQTVIALVYPDAEIAGAAAEIIPDRIEIYTSMATQQSFREMLDERGVTSIETTVEETEDRATLLVTFHAPLPGTDATDDQPTPQSIGLIYSLFVDALLRRDLGWLATSLD